LQGFRISSSSFIVKSSLYASSGIEVLSSLVSDYDSSITS